MKFIILFLLFLSYPTLALDKIEEAKSLNYIPATYESLSRVIWRFDLHDLANDKIIDDYAAIINCDLYKKYYNNDFQWQKIKSGLRREVDYYAKNFPNRFEIKAAIPIDRYDFTRSAFIISQNFQMNNAGSIRIPVGDINQKPCLTVGSNYFSRHIKFSADNKFSLTEIPVSPDKAKEILARMSKYRYEDAEGKRVVTLRFRIKVNGIKKYEVKSNVGYLTFSGQLDEITFYEDPHMTKPIFVKSFKRLN